MVKQKNYVNNADLTDAVVKYQKDCRRAHRARLPQPPMPHYIGECIMSICNRLTVGKGFNFQSYTYRDEMVADAIERCCYAILKFNAKKSSGAFSYLTTVAVNAQKKRINDEKKQRYIQHKFFISQHVHGEIEGQEPDEKSHKVISDFEEKQQRKKELTNRGRPRKI